MWEVSAQGKPETIYGSLNGQFEEHFVSTEYDETTYQKPGMRNPSRLGNRTKTEPGHSEQFRACLKAFQGMLPLLKGSVKVQCGGDGKNSIWMKVSDV